MTSGEQDFVERLLLLKLQELKWYSRLNEIRAERTPDELDESQQAHDRELTVAAMQRDVDSANEIRVALQRLQNGQYGLCILCDKKISLARLRAVPWTCLCVACQGRVEAERQRSDLRG
jgi:DnaK suppressor protein